MAQGDLKGDLEEKFDDVEVGPGRTPGTTKTIGFVGSHLDVVPVFIFPTTRSPFLSSLQRPLQADP